MKQNMNSRKFLWKLLKGTAFAFGFLALPSAAQSLTLKVERRENVASYAIASGDIDVGDDKLIQGALIGGPDIEFIVFNSPGGDVDTAMKIGRIIRSSNTSTMVAPRGDCLSSCLLMFIGGVKRNVPESAQLGSHQFYWRSGETPHNAASISQSMIASIMRYFIEMKIDTEALVYITDTPPDEMFVFSEHALVKFNLTTPRKPNASEISRDVYIRDCVETHDDTTLTSDYCTPENRWQFVTVHKFMEDHPEYKKGTPLYTRLDEAVRAIQGKATDPFDPSVLEDAHARVRTAKQ